MFVTTHSMDEAETLCDVVSIIDKGRIKESGTPKELCARIGQWTVEYDSEEGKRMYRFFSDWNDAQSFASQMSEHNPASRRTHLEDVFLEETGRDNMKGTEKRLRV